MLIHLTASTCPIHQSIPWAVRPTLASSLLPAVRPTLASSLLPAVRSTLASSLPFYIPISTCLIFGDGGRAIVTPPPSCFRALHAGGMAITAPSRRTSWPPPT